jgi:glycerol-1-phosphate dehydrogenase [NAD(P)+]
MDASVLESAKHPNLAVGRGIVDEHVSRLESPYVLVSQPEPLAAISPHIPAGASATVMADSLDERDLDDLVRTLPQVASVFGLGGGMAMDVAKYISWKTGAALVLAPSVVSVDASVTNTVAVRRNGSVEYDGFVVADPIVVDLQLISGAPRRLNRAGVGDLLSIQTGRFDWALGARAGSIAFDADIDAAAKAILADLYAVADDVAVVSDRAIEHIIRAYVKVNALLLDVGHSGPEEGSEHYFAYAAEAATGRSFVHGELVGLGTVLMSGLQQNDQIQAAAFLDHCRVEWRPDQLGLDQGTLADILLDLPAFVRRAGLPHSIIDEQPLDRPAVAALLDSIPTAVRPSAAGSAQEDSR